MRLALALALTFCVSACATLTYTHPVTKKRVSCPTGFGWQADATQDRCVRSAIAAGYEIDQDP